MIEMLHAAETIKDLLHDDDLSGSELSCSGTRRHEGVGVIEAPRGTLIHHYRVDDDDLVTMCNLIVSTTHNNQPMNEAIRRVARRYLNGRQLSEGLLNHIEVAIRAFDPCLSCATHALGKMPLQLELQDAAGQVIAAAAQRRPDLPDALRPCRSRRWSFSPAATPAAATTRSGRCSSTACRLAGRSEGLADGFELIGDFQWQVEHALDLAGRRLALFIDAGERTPAPFVFVRCRRCHADPELACAVAGSGARRTGAHRTTGATDLRARRCRRALRTRGRPERRREPPRRGCVRPAASLVPYSPC
jgi:hypothetical protein